LHQSYVPEGQVHRFPNKQSMAFELLLAAPSRTLQSTNCMFKPSCRFSTVLQQGCHKRTSFSGSGWHQRLLNATDIVPTPRYNSFGGGSGWGFLSQLHVVVQHGVRQSVLNGPAWSFPYQPVHLASTSAMYIERLRCQLRFTSGLAFM